MRILFIIVALVFPIVSLAEPANLEAAIDSLDALISHRNEYLHRQRLAIDRIEAQLAAPEGRSKSELYTGLADAFRRYNIDSAIYYYDMALKNVPDANSLEYRRVAWAKSSIMPVNGLVMEAQQLYEDNRPQLSDSAYLGEYYYHGVHLYMYITDFHTLPAYRLMYAKKSMQLNDSLLSILTPGEPIERFHRAYQYYYAGKYALAVSELNELLKVVGPDDNMYARVHAILSDYYALEGRDEESQYHLALAAAGDIQAATQEFTALKRLGMKLFEQGDVDRAYKYLMLALESSVAAGSRLRTLENAQSLPVISQTFRERDSRRMAWMIAIVAVLLAAIAVIAVMMVVMRRKQAKVNELQTRLKDNVELKDAYIGRVLSMCSLYIERMEEFNRLAGRKIKAGQVQDLYHMIESGKILQEQATQFYEVFDKAFFGIYPDFIEQVNELMQEDKRIQLVSPGRLTPESRILAFMRLGIDDSAKLSKFLGLSLNTIYTYRNRLKSRALDRENFERQVKEIGKIR
ncbi:MAG: hypothetical protein K2I56_08020 [Muribaculaceae bacterium]|nr:hypothetical protein [Muribaculaceae bacterium]